jgi:hypothetical protein
MSKASKYSPEIRERAVRLVQEARKGYTRRSGRPLNWSSGYGRMCELASVLVSRRSPKTEIFNGGNMAQSPLSILGQVETMSFKLYR